MSRFPRSRRESAFRFLTGTLAVALAASTVGCGEDEATSGALVVPYQLGNDRSCEELGVDYVVAELDDGYREQMVDCSEGEVRFSSVEEGSYRVVLYGMAGGFPVMDNLDGDELVQRVAGQGATTTVDPPVILTSAPAKLQLRWDFGFSSCTSADVASFRIHAWEAQGSNRLLQTTINCSEPGEGTGNYRTVDDPDRKLGGELLGQVSVQALDAKGMARGDVVTFTFDPPGAGHPVRLSVECDTSGCEGSGQPD